ncbi:MAG TPA: hypothetical protein VFI73_02065 [Candidatus Nitrosopolaris sp.]|nr:hypothetical protein [Candidatus Nitrosopolaris sp.]
MDVYKEGQVSSYSNPLLKITNYGSLPTTSWKWTIMTDDESITVSDMRSTEDSISLYTASAIFPNQSWSKIIELEEGAKKREPSLFVDILMRYEYANNSVGESGIIFEFEKTATSMDNCWIKPIS